ncbi:MAG: glycosyltransferase, partial [Candidatus Heimdallarchaeota archaeon]
MTESVDALEKELLVENYTDIGSFCERIIKINGDSNSSKRENSSKTKNSDSNENGLKVIITIPAYNEEEKIGNVIQNIKTVMDNAKYRYNYLVLVVNDGSTDKTADEATKAGAFVYSHKINKGLAETFRTEMEICSELGTEIIVHTDA